MTPGLRRLRQRPATASVRRSNPYFTDAFLETRPQPLAHDLSPSSTPPPHHPDSIDRCTEGIPCQKGKRNALRGRVGHGRSGSPNRFPAALTASGGERR